MVESGADLHPLVAPGIRERLHRLAQARQRPELGLVFLNGTIIRAHQKAAGAKREWLLLGFGVVGITYATKPATRVPSRALPRRRALCTSWKKPR